VFRLDHIVVGGFQSNCYVLEDESYAEAVLIDPGADPKKILQWVEGVPITKILITHGHSDHVGALAEVRKVLDCPVGGHTLDAQAFGLEFDSMLQSGDRLSLGRYELEVCEIPGHTPGSIAFALHEDTFERAIVGDAIFPGGPGHTRSNKELQELLRALERTVFTWPNEIALYPGHGVSTTVGAEREAFTNLLSQDLSEDFFGDVTWR
jgi:glyoxylase-like metal-dependent hydrolase (beta-lactamase superfamily II)